MLTINNQVTNKLTLKQKEAKTLIFTYNVDITEAIFSLVVSNRTGEQIITKIDDDFDKSDKINKIVKVCLDSSDLDVAKGTYDLGLRTVWDDVSSVDISDTIKLTIEESLF